MFNRRKTLALLLVMSAAVSCKKDDDTNQTGEDTSTVNPSVSSGGGFGSLPEQPDLHCGGKAAAIDNVAVVAGGTNQFLQDTQCTMIASHEALEGWYDIMRMDAKNPKIVTWEKQIHNPGRKYMGVIAAGRRMYFAGGRTNFYGEWEFSNLLQIFDVDTGEFSEHTMQEARSGMATATVGGKVYFIGGHTQDLTATSGVWSGMTDLIEILDIETNTWSTAKMPYARTDIEATVIGQKILITGGPSRVKLIDIWDLETDTWTEVTMPEYRSRFTAAATGGKLYLAGGIKQLGTNHLAMDRVDIFDPANSTWTTAKLGTHRGDIRTIAAGKYLLFAGGYTSHAYLDQNGDLVPTAAAATEAVDVLDAETGQWFTSTLSTPRWTPIVYAVNDIAFMMGGNGSGGSVTGTWDLFFPDEMTIYNDIFNTSHPVIPRKDDP